MHITINTFVRKILSGVVLAVMLFIPLGASAAYPTPPRFLTLPFYQNSLHPVLMGDTWERKNGTAHEGVDYWRADGQPFSILAAADGDAMYVPSDCSTWGNYIKIRHQLNGETWFTLYAHVSSSTITADGAYHRVIQGTEIGIAGKTGFWKKVNGVCSDPYTFVHLHFELSKDNIGRPNRVDPYGVYLQNVGNNYPGQSLAFTTNPPSFPGTIPPSICSAPSNGIPRDTAVLNNDQVTFTWTPPSCDGLDYYTFRVSTNSDIENPSYWIGDHGVDKSASSWTETILSQYNGQTLYWAIWPHNASGYGARGGPWAFMIDTTVTIPPVIFPSDSWNISYYPNKDLTNQCNSSTTNQTFIYMNWGDSAPMSNCTSDDWSASFTRNVTFQGGDYSFAVEADDWGRIYVDGTLFVDKWNGASQHYESHHVTAGSHNVRIDFADTSGGAYITAWWNGPGFEIPKVDPGDPNQWYADYWINPTQTWDAFAKINEGTGVLNHDWGDGSPGWGIPTDNFSSKFTRTVTFECGIYRFIMDHDDGAKFYLDGVLELDRWTGAIGYTSIDLPVSAGPHILEVDQYENGGGAHIYFDWQKLQGCQPAAPTLDYPGDAASLPWNVDLTLSWVPVTGATQYYAVLQGGPSADITSDWISATQWHVPGLWPGTYTWSVTARNDSGSSSASSRSFTILEEPPDTEIPVVDWVAPVGNGQTYAVNNGMVTLTVSATDNRNVSEVDFSRWDAVNSVPVSIGTAYASPYSVDFDTSTLDPGSNEIDAVAYDDAGNVSDKQSIYLDRSVQTFQLDVSKTGNGFGTLTSDPAGIDCGSTCSASFASTDSVTLYATASTGSTFTGWGGACFGAGGCTVSMDAARSVTANFTLNTYQLHVSTAGDGWGEGTVTSSPGGIDCGVYCSVYYAYNTDVNLTATYPAGVTFNGWGGGWCSGAGDCTVRMDAAKSVSATFTKNCYLLTLSHTGSGSDPSPDQANSTGCSSGYYNAGVILILTASPASGYHVGGWTGTDNDLSTSEAVFMEIPAIDWTATVNYVTDTPTCYTLTLAHNGSGSDPIASPGNSTGCSSGQYLAGESISLTAVPGTGYQVGSWSGTGNDVITSTNNSLVMPASDQTVTVNYVPVSTNTDLVIESITASPESPLVHQGVVFTVRVRNQGSSATPSNFFVDFYIDRLPVQDCTDTGSYFMSIGPLAAGAAQDLQFTYGGFDTTGVHDLYAFADTNCSVAESSEDNNVLGPVQVTVQTDTEIPVVDWVAPVGNSQTYAVNNQLVTLTASASDNVWVARVRFYRWDAVNSIFVEIANSYTSPYSAVLDTTVLNPGWNEIDVQAYDASGNFSYEKYIWLDHSDISSVNRVFLPLVTR